MGYVTWEKKIMRGGTLIFILCALLQASAISQPNQGSIMTVNGPIHPSDLTFILPHEHLLVDFIGADSTGYHRWSKSDVIKVVLPYLEEAAEKGVQFLADCTPAFLGRDPLLLRELSKLSGINIITNTGYYAAVKHKYLPEHAFHESAEELAYRWIAESKEGIEGTNIFPGFIKTSVDFHQFTDVQKKLARAAALTHLQTGLTIATHAGPFEQASQLVEIFSAEGASPEAFIWVHAQVEKNYDNLSVLAEKGVWISLDGVNHEETDEYVQRLLLLRNDGHLDKVILSHDAGWYTPGEPNGGSYRSHTALMTHLIPALKEAGFTDQELKLLTEDNPREALTISIRSNSK